MVHKGSNDAHKLFTSTAGVNHGIKINMEIEKFRRLSMYPLPFAGAEGGADPFLTKFAESCCDAGITVDRIPTQPSKDSTICYVHWPHHWSRASTLKYSLGIGEPYAGNLPNKRTIWDAHDLVDHRTAPSAKRSLLIRYYKQMYLQADSVIVHENSAIAPLNEYFGERRLLPMIAPFGPFDVFHGPEISKKSARTSQFLPADAQIFLLFGTDRENRRHEQVVSAFLKNSKSNQFLCVAGGNDGDVQVSVRNHPRVRFFGSYLANPVVRDLFCASDFVIEHGLRQLTSAVVRTAISYGKPVISRDFGCTSDMAAGAAVWMSEDNSLCDIFAMLSNIPESDYLALAWAASQRNSERTWSKFGNALASTIDQLTR